SYDKEHTYSEEDQALFAQIANHVSSALQGLQSMDRLERAVHERTQELEREVAERSKVERLQRALYEIASLSASASAESDAKVLYARLHEISIPYFVDEKDLEAPLKRFEYGIGMSSFVLKKRKPMLLDGPAFAALMAGGEINEPLGNQGIASWMGCPMMVGEQALGVIIVQSYDASVTYSQNELD